ncbi:hypothetical protein SCP_0408930 [Sparassis crispa]|uniref:Uncharacterized protein n=1 Tax=Sparassis crispa TaxID=139825 RepID=A0A401GK36_9APHY|nr:hypothetical protein SCP_0408930 [Sparassis crispa]GBE82509.1 hypothetical protein SCP_0408930 [Sparassis crispa]
MRERCFGCRASAVKRGDNATPQSIEEGEDTMNNLAFEEDRLSEKELFAMML